jgi:homoserine kinase type II
VAEDDLPYFLSLMAYLAERGVSARSRRRTGKARSIASWPAVRRRSSFPGGHVARRPNAAHCAGVGEALARMHLAGRDFPLFRKIRSVAGWRPLFDLAAPRADSIQAGLSDFIARELEHLEANWPADLPVGVIHADLFPDNVFFLGDKPRLIDFPFSCNDILAYDVAICLNAWCFEPDHSFNVTKARVPQRLWPRAQPVRCRAGRTAAAGARRRTALPADAAGRFSQRAAGCAGQAEGTAGICPQAALPAGRQDLERLRRDPAGCVA